MPTAYPNAAIVATAAVVAAITFTLLTITVLAALDPETNTRLIPLLAAWADLICAARGVR
jgi:hypothetical protein